MKDGGCDRFATRPPPSPDSVLPNYDHGVKFPLKARVLSLLAAALVVLTAATATGGATASAASSPPNEFTVMTRNLYLGADIAEAMKYFPDFPKAAQAMWTQVAATSFTSRVGALASDIEEQLPAVLGLQEATTWSCLDASGKAVTVFDFTQQLLDRLGADGKPYVIAQANGVPAVSPGFAIAPLAGLTMVTDPTTLRPKTGLDTTACGIQIADVLAVRSDLAGDITATGVKNFPTTTKFAGAFDIKRGYAWADMTIDARTVRLVTTHLESVWSKDAEPAMAAQARELLADLQGVTTPIVAMGDFNADPRDPRPAGTPNPAGQPEVTASCPGRTCSPYWIMTDAGYTDAGPDALDPKNLTWGMNALLAGPDLTRLDAALAMGNDLGFTERLDYVFVHGDISVVSSSLVGREWPTGATSWDCTTPEQIAATKAAAAKLGIPVPATGRCLATDHLGIAATLALPSTATGSSSSAVGWLIAGAVLVVIVLGAVVIVLRRRHSTAG